MNVRSILFLLALPSAAQNQYIVQPLIGSGSHGDGGPAVQALLDGPFGLAEDSQGNVYISESNAGVIRRVRPDGGIELFAGSGIVANGPDGRPALESDLLSPTVLLLDRDGGLIFADQRGCRIRKVQTDGMIRSLVGTGRCAGSASGGLGGGGSRDGRALEIDLGAVGGMVLDSAGLLIFSDETGNTVRRLDSDGQVRTIAGTGQSGFSGDDGQATSASFRSPRGLAFDGAGNLYVADGASCRVRRIGTDGIIKTVAGNGTCATASTNFVEGGATSRSIGTVTALAYDETRAYDGATGSILIASPGMARVLRLDIASTGLSAFLGSGLRGAIDTTAPLQYRVDRPSAILLSARLGLLVADSSSFRVIQMRDNTVTPFAGTWPQLDAYPASLTAPFLRPKGLCVNAAGSLLVVDAGAERILSFRQPSQLSAFAGARYPTGYSGGDDGPAMSAQLADPKRVACAPNGDVYMSQGNRIRVINQQGIIRTFLNLIRISGGGSSSLNDPTGLLIDAEGRLLFSEAGAHRVIRYDPSSQTGTVIAGTGTAGSSGDGGLATEAQLNSPGDLAFDSQGNLLIADRENRRIRRVSPGGTIETIAGSDRAFWHTDTSGQLATDVGLDRIDGLAVDANDNIYISEYLRVSVVDTDRRIRILTGYVGQDDAGNKSYIDGPLNGCDGLAVDASGRLYFSVRHGGRVMAANPPGVAPINPGNPPTISDGGVVSSMAFGAFPAIAPGSWIEIFGANLATSSRSWSNADFLNAKAPTSLDGTRVTIGGQAAFVSYISPGQVNAQVPSGVPAGAQQLTVSTPAGTSAPYTITVNSAQPGLLAPASFKIADKSYAVALPNATTYILPSGAIAGVTSRPARPGETITLYGVGFGSVTPPVAAGEVVQQNNTLDQPIQFLFGQTAGTVTYAGLAPGAIGLYQFNMIVPNVADNDAVPLTFTLGGVAGQQTLYTAVRR